MVYKAVATGPTGPIGPQGQIGATGETGPTGPIGPSGTADTIRVGNVITGEPGMNAEVIDVTGGPDHVFDFIIPRGKDGSNTNDFCCFCVQQMTNLLQQIISLYPGYELLFTLSNGDAIIGTLNSITLGSNGKAGVIEIINTPSNISQLLSICSIDTVTINNAAYNVALNYLFPPDPLPSDCCIDCDEALRSRLPLGTTDVLLITNTQAPIQGDLIRSEYGVIVLNDLTNNTVSFVSSCRIDVAYTNFPT